MGEIIGESLQGHGGAGASLPLWVVVAGGLIIALVVGTLMVSVWLDWRRRARRRAGRVWRDYPANQNTRPLAWRDPAPAPAPELKVLPKAGEKEAA